MQVHIDRGGERFGPYSLEEVNAYLANGTLLPTDQAWEDGMADWVPIEQIPGVTLAGGSAPPPPPPAPAAGASCPQCQAPVEASQVICMGCGTRLQGEPTMPKGSKKKLLIGIGAGVGVLAIIAGIWFFLIREDGSNPQNVDAQKPNPAKTDTKVGGKKPEPTKSVSNKLITNPIVEKAIRDEIKKPTGELTKADLEKVKTLNLENNQLTDVTALKGLTQLTELYLYNNQLTDVTALKGLTQLTVLSLANNQLTDVTALKELTQLKGLSLYNNPALTKAQIAELKKALPKCRISSNPTK